MTTPPRAWSSSAYGTGVAPAQIGGAGALKPQRGPLTAASCRRDSQHVSDSIERRHCPGGPAPSVASLHLRRHRPPAALSQLGSAGPPSTARLFDIQFPRAPYPGQSKSVTMRSEEGGTGGASPDGFRSITAPGVARRPEGIADGSLMHILRSVSHPRNSSTVNTANPSSSESANPCATSVASNCWSE